MNLLAHVAQLTGEYQLHLRVHILDAVFNHELAFLRQLIDILQDKPDSGISKKSAKTKGGLSWLHKNSLTK